MYFEEFDPDTIYVDVPDGDISETEDIPSDIDEDEHIQNLEKCMPMPDENDIAMHGDEMYRGDVGLILIMTREIRTVM